MATVSLHATDLPAVTDAAIDPAKSAPATLSALSSGEVPSTKINAAILAIEFLARMVVGGYAVLFGLTPTSTGLTLNLSAGFAAIDGLVELPNGVSKALPASQSTIWVYLFQDGHVDYSLSSTVPAGKVLLLCKAVTSGSAITAIDITGVKRALGGMIWRATADTGAPGDTLGSDERVWTKTAGGTYLWNGAAHVKVD